MFSVFKAWIAQLYRRALNRVFAFFQADRRRSSIADLERSLLDESDSLRVEIQSDSEHDQKVPDLESSIRWLPLSNAAFDNVQETNHRFSFFSKSLRSEQQYARASLQIDDPQYDKLGEVFWGIRELVQDIAQVKRELEKLNTEETDIQDQDRKLLLNSLEFVNKAIGYLTSISLREEWYTQEMGSKLALLSNLLLCMPETQEAGNKLSLLLPTLKEHNSKETRKQIPQLLEPLKLAKKKLNKNELKKLPISIAASLSEATHIHVQLNVILQWVKWSEEIQEKLDFKVTYQPTPENKRLSIQFLFEDPEATFTGIEKEIYDICEDFENWENYNFKKFKKELFSDIHEMVCSGEKKHQDYLKQCCTRLRAMLAKLSFNKGTSTTTVDQAVDDEKPSQYHYGPGF